MWEASQPHLITAKFSPESAMNGTIERINVAGLHGRKNIAARMRDNTLILVGENGSGKTTFLRILFHFLSGRWYSLLQYKFEYISATISGKEYIVTHELLARAFERIDRRFLADLPSPMRHRVIDWMSNNELRAPPPDLERYMHRAGWPWEAVIRQLELFEEKPTGARKELKETIDRLRGGIQAQILYLPTYRRIERELGSIFEGLNLDELRREKERHRPPTTEDSYIELVEFGMKDVQQAIESSLEKLREFARQNLYSLTLRHLGDVVGREYVNTGLSEIGNISEETVKSVLERIDETILTAHQKRNLIGIINKARAAEALDEHSKIICHYFLKLLDFQEKLREHERHVADFCKLCSTYIVDKDFVYSSSDFGFSIKPRQENERDRPISLSELSSGEKQIVSLFSHLYLSGKERFFVLIDEPELSLSVPWQRRFLEDIRGGSFCSGLVAVTHSPFIYDNSLKTYTHALGEFVGI